MLIINVEIKYVTSRKVNCLNNLIDPVLLTALHTLFSNSVFMSDSINNNDDEDGNRHGTYSVNTYIHIYIYIPYISSTYNYVCYVVTKYACFAGDNQYTEVVFS
jgi:hypothetical protein